MHPLHHLSTFFLTPRCRKNPLNIAERCFIPLLGVPLFFKYKIKALLPSHQSQTALRFTLVEKNGRFLLWNFVDDEFQKQETVLTSNEAIKVIANDSTSTDPSLRCFFLGIFFSPGICRNTSTSIVWATRVLRSCGAFWVRDFFSFSQLGLDEASFSRTTAMGHGCASAWHQADAAVSLVWVRLCCTSFCFRFPSCYLFLVQVRVVFICLFLKATIMPFIFLVLLLLLLFLLVLLLLLRSFFCFCWLLLLSSSSSSSSSLSASS